MKTSIGHYKGWQVITLHGPLVLRNLSDVRTAIDAAADGRECNIALDLSLTKLVDSGGVSFLVNLSGRVKERGGCLVVVGANSDIQSVFSIVGLEGRIRMYPSREQFERECTSTDG